jgi:hypothetical protein
MPTMKPSLRALSERSVILRISQYGTGVVRKSTAGNRSVRGVLLIRGDFPRCAGDSTGVGVFDNIAVPSTGSGSSLLSAAREN